MADQVDSVVTAQIVDVQTKLVKNGTMTLWEVRTPDGTKWTTSRAEIGNAALALKGQIADMRVSIKQNGDFTNHYVNKIRLSPGAATTPVTVAAANAQSAQEQAQAVTYDQYKSLDAEKEQRKNESIYRQVATKVAAELASDLAEFWANVETLLDFYRTGVVPGPTTEAVTRNAPADSYHAALPPDDDIPF